MVEEQEKVKARNSEKYTVKKRQVSRMPPSVADRQGSGCRSRRWRGCRALCTHACSGGCQAVYRDHPLAEAQCGTPAHPPAPLRTQLQPETPRSVARAANMV